MAEYTKGAWSGSTGGSAVQFQGAFSTTFAWTQAALGIDRSTGEITIASTTADVLPGDLLFVDPGIGASSAVLVSQIRQSTAAASRVTIVLGNVSTAASATLSGTARITWVKLGNS